MISKKGGTLWTLAVAAIYPVEGVNALRLQWFGKPAACVYMLLYKSWYKGENAWQKDLKLWNKLW